MFGDSDWIKISPHTWHYTPQDVAAPIGDHIAASSAPDLVILFPWMYAQPRHIQKYTAGYQKLFPQIPILLILQDGSDLTWRTPSSQFARLRPAVNYIDAFIKRHRAETQVDGPPRILVHIWSNGGAYQAIQLDEAFSRSSSTGLNVLPISGVLIDSAPGILQFKQGIVALSMALPKFFIARILGKAVITLFLVLTALLRKLTGREDRITFLRRMLNAKDAAFVRSVNGGIGVRRCYIYSEGDKLVPREHVTKHVREAREVIDRPAEGAVFEAEVESGQSRRKGTRVWEENFGTSQHVAHMMQDPKRYWQVVRDFWETCDADIA